MKILFICGSAEPGKDGVGDYTLRLAAELVRQGHAVKVISLNDKFIKTNLNDSLYKDNIVINVLRLSYLAAWTERTAAAKNLINDFNPDWISLQYVPFSFNDKGLPFNLGTKLKNMGGERHWHIMFHELWGGINNSKVSTLKSTIYNFIQKKCVLYNLNSIKPALITTSIAVYKASLKKYEVAILPLFSNITFSGKIPVNKDDFIKVVHFGTFSGDLAEFNTQLLWLRNIGVKMSKKIIFTSAGNGGQFKLPSLIMAKSIFNEENISDLGLLSSSKISDVLSKSDIGISRADGLLWGKSGTTMAMLEHGLPVVLKGKREELNNLGSSFNYELQLFFPDDTFNVLPQKKEAVNALPKIALQLVELYKHTK